jgi:FkbM family methyltransferase
LIGLQNTTRVTRGGINWDLDLAEGIDLAIYLGRYQRLGRHLRVNVLRSGATVFDIGANVGAFTLPLAAAVGEQGHVIAIEATDFAFRKLAQNCALNSTLASRIVRLQAVLVSHDAEPPQGGSTGIYSSWRLDRALGLQRHPAHGGIKMSTKDAATTTLDRLLQSDPTLASLAESIRLIKLDVDGSELAVLRGARSTLLNARPFILIEIAPYVQNERPGGLAELLGELMHLGYKLEDADTGKSIPCSAEAITRMIPHGAGMDVLCSPLL